MPVISIIVPVYKVEKYIAKCIDSILQSTFKDFELLLIDDGSPDKSGSMCDEYAEKDSRIRVFHQKNEGVSSARNVGIRKSRGKWITFIDSDDFISSNFLANLYSPIANGEDVDFVQGKYTNWSSGMSTNDSIRKENNYYVGDEYSDLFQKMVGLTCSKLFRCENVRNWSDSQPLLFDKKIKICEDLVFIIEYLNTVHRFAVVDEAGYYYRQDNFDSALKTYKRDDYELMTYSHKRVKNAIKLYAENKSLNILPLYKKHIFQISCYSPIVALYKTKHTHAERIFAIKNDWDREDFELLRYIHLNPLRNSLIWLLRKRMFRCYDFVMSIFTTIKN